MPHINQSRGLALLQPLVVFTSPDRVLDHDHGHEDNGYGKADEVCDLGGLGGLYLIAHGLHRFVHGSPSLEHIEPQVSSGHYFEERFQDE